MNGTQGATPAARRGLRAWLVPGILLALLVFLVVDAVVKGPLTSLDHSIGHAIQSVAHRRSLRWVRHGPDTPARVINFLGSFEVALPLLGLGAGLAAFRQRAPRPLIAAAGGAGAALVLMYIGKRLIREAAPRQHHLGPHALGSFPSGHMMTACVCYFLIVVLLFPPGSAFRRLALGAATVLCALIGASLLWCDLHWFSDVVGAAVLSGLVVPLAGRLGVSSAGAPGPPVRPESAALDRARGSA